jgi:hypothetical protein
MSERNLKKTSLILSATLLLFISGCPAPNPGPDSPAYVFHRFVLPPRPRRGSYASSTIGTTFTEPGRLGRHGYYIGLTEQNGIVYTCRGGHIDVSHVRKCADWTAYIAAGMYKKLMKNESRMSFKMLEPSSYHVYVHYPHGWSSLGRKDKDRIAFEASIEIARHLVYIATTWHEIVTWFGYKFPGLYSEYPSAFSWEDTYSNLLGTHIGARALRDGRGNFDEAVTKAIDSALDNLIVQPAETARKASEMVRDKWFSGDYLFFVKITARNFDIGFDDGFVKPFLVDGLEQCGGTDIFLLDVPSLDSLLQYGITAELEIEPREWETNRILKIVYPSAYNRPKHIVPAIHFPIIVDYIRKHPAEKVVPFFGPLGK